MSRTTHLVAGLAAVAAVVVPSPSEAAPMPSRSGTIIGGWFPGAAYLGPSPRGCLLTTECAAWWASGCRPELAGRDPGLHDSIVDVRGLGSRTRVWEFLVQPDGPTAASPVVWGGLTVEVWSGACKRLGELGTYSGGSVGILERDRFRIPVTARWMTVASSDNTTVRWSLTRVR